MTQAYNLAILANAVNTSGQLNVGTNATGTLPLANGGTGTTNTVNTVVAGTGISVSTSGTQVTVSASGAGTVTSVATGNGLSGGTITSTGTLVIACPGFNTVGSYSFAGAFPNSRNSIAAGGTYSAGLSTNQVFCAVYGGDGFFNSGSATISGTWRWMSQGNVPQCGGFYNGLYGIACRVS